MNKKTLIILTCLCIVIAAMDVSGLPSVLLSIRVADVNPFILPLMVNFCLIGLLAVAVIKGFGISYRFGLTKTGLSDGLKRYAWPGIAAGVLSFVAFFIGLFPFDYKPTLWRVLIEGVLYYVGVGIVEEFYVRGLFLNLVEELLHKRANKTTLAIVISSLVFGLGHVPGTLGMGIGVVVFKLITTVSMGLYFGVIYKKTNNLWVPILLHVFIDICALPYCFTQNMRYETISMVLLTAVYVALFAYCAIAWFSRCSKQGISDQSNA